jgi:phospholipid-translocating ATPase
MNKGKSKESDSNSRRLYLNMTPTVQSESQFCSPNKVATSKYTILTFLPKNIIEQFYGLANFYFLTLVILQLFPLFQEVGFLVTATPIITIVTATAIKVCYILQRMDWKI